MIFDVVSFSTNRHIPLSIAPGSNYPVTNVAVSYLIVPGDSGKNRLLIKLIVKYNPGLFGFTAARFLPWGNLIMIRKQLLNFKRLSEGKLCEIQI
jgi:hypothetical protein